MKRLLSLVLLAAFGCIHNAPTDPLDFDVEGRIALASLTSLSDGHLSQIDNHFDLLAKSDDGQSADWARIKGRLAAVQQVNVPGLYWFALSNGSYWSVAQGPATGNLSDRSTGPG